jgi:hypothetical protein
MRRFYSVVNEKNSILNVLSLVQSFQSSYHTRTDPNLAMYSHTLFPITVISYILVVIARQKRQITKGNLKSRPISSVRRQKDVLGSSKLRDAISSVQPAWR